MQTRGEIRDLELQPRFPLYVPCLYDGAGESYALAGRYIADFRYIDCTTGAAVIEDVKGMRLPLYKHKIKHLRLQENIIVTEVR